MKNSEHNFRQGLIFSQAPCVLSKMLKTSIGASAQGLLIFCEVLHMFSPEQCL